MASTESAQSKAALLMHIARRNDFAARIKKYEAKVRQEQMLRALRREQQEMCAFLIEQRAQNTAASIHHESEESQEHILVSEQNGTVREIQAALPWIFSSSEHSPRASSSSPKVITKSSHLSSICLARTSHCTDKRISHHTPMVIALKPSTAINVDVTSIAAALEIKVKKADMAVCMQERAFQCARDCLNTTNKLVCKHTAYTLKKEFDKAYGPAWHCIVGTSFGSYVTHSLGGFIYFTMEKVSVLLFKTTVELVDR